MFPIKRYRVKNHVSVTMQTWLFLSVLGHRLYCQLFYGHHPRSQLFAHSQLFSSLLAQFEDRRSLCSEVGSDCWSLLCCSTCLLASGHWIRKKWWSLPAAVVDSCNWSSRHDIYNSSDTKNSPNVSPNKEITAHFRSLLSQNNCFCIKWLKVHWRTKQKNLVIDYDWLEVISYTASHCVILLITNTKVIQM